MGKKFKITWGIDDGYQVPGRKYSFNMSLPEFVYCDTLESIVEHLEREIQEQLEITVNWYCEDIEAYAHDILAAKLAEQEEKASAEEDEGEE